jgi:hypothetical protein
MANIFLAQRGEASPPQTVGVNWVQSYIKRTPSLAGWFSRRYDYRRAECEDPKVIHQWFNRVINTI